ncbi:unnamed protein product [Clonostachys rosea]|uniref:Uncharacterized protein n=1 Tax=Bionectria ochroleuca TaxID=29856 RepID=A0ABY6UW58_BIOOC|nr:unnamed protein product [Clonostachys rosea]
MESPSPKVVPVRKFKPIAIGKCHVQTAADRFGPGAEGAIKDRERLALGMQYEGTEQPFLWPSGSGVDNKDEDEDEPGDTAKRSIYRLVPSMQSNRNNLTALSQLYNLYFVAYQGCIFVYRLRSGAQHALPRYPDLQLKPPASDEARAVEGFLDARSGHAINHIITGYLGHEEIILAAHDDGDVTAYKTKDVAEYVLGSKRAAGSTPVKGSQSAPKHGKRPRPRPFFHENVGKSAWGLAIHQQSRLIAISSNRWEVTVFAFALYDDISQQPRTPPSDERRDEVEDWVRQRQRTWRIIILLGHHADNLPNVTFLDNKEGNAEKICAIDIKGSIWIADIWKPHQRPSQILPFDGQDIISDEFFPSVSRGWGVLAFTDSCYMEVESVEELIGFPEHECTIKPSRLLPQPMANIKPVLENIPENPCPPSATDRSSMVWRRAQPANENFLAVFGGVMDSEDEGDDVYDDSDGDEDDDEDGHEGEDEDEDDDEEEDEDEDDGDENDGDDGFDDGNIGTAGSEAEAAGPGGSTASPVPPSTLLANFEEWIQLVGQMPTEQVPGPWIVHDPVPPPQPIMVSTQVHLWPFEDTFTDLSEALGDLEDAFSELEDALPHIGSSLPQLDAALAHSSNPVSACSSHMSRPPNRVSEPIPFDLDLLLPMIYYPHTGSVAIPPMDRSSRIQFAKSSRMDNNNHNNYDRGPYAASERLAQGYHILRAYEKDFELWEVPRRRTEPQEEIGMSCGDALEFQRSQDPLSSSSFRATSRLSLLAHVPELSLVVLGSPTGRVLVASLTRLSSKVNKFKERGKWKRGIRVEWVLPNKTEEAKYRENRRALHGMAIGRIPDDGDQNGEQAERGQLLPRRYRLMLHYQNHDIFSYEVTRHEQTGKICLF